jgi:hypothetical protein
MENRLPQKLQLGIEYLKEAGLNLFSILEVGRLPDRVTSRLADVAFPLSPQSRIILIGNGGRGLWEALSAAQWQQPDPIDRYSSEAARHFAGQVLTPGNYQLLYPGDTPVALQQLGAGAGWHTASPLGLGINPRWGLWYAYRAALLTNDPLPEMCQPAPLPPCASCGGKPCLSVCPAGALSETATIDMGLCAGYRLSPDSSCADRCLARLSCPVSTEQRYTLEQVQYHYRLSLETLRHYFG